jgi:hemolysin-activating ACP:hemolysin acyltransferase
VEDFSQKIDFQESAFEQYLSTSFGHATRVLVSSARRAELIHELGIHLWPAVRLNQIAFLFNSKGAPVAFATWAFVTDEVAQLLQSDPKYRLDLSEWNEGDQLWLVDFVAPFGDARNLIRKIRATCLPGCWRVRGIRRHVGGKAPRVVDLKLAAVQRHQIPAKAHDGIAN